MVSAAARFRSIAESEDVGRTREKCRGRGELRMKRRIQTMQAPSDSPSMTVSELTRLRRDFERHASRYTDQTLTVYFLEAGVDQRPDEFRKPNHSVSLFQYMGRLTSEADVQRLMGSSRTKFGLTEAEFAIFAVLEGPETELFRRMATRAGSIVPLAVTDMITSILRARSEENASGPGKPVFVSNPNPFAVWVNLVLTCIANFQPERFRGPRLAVDPFAASIPACEYLIRQSTSPPEVLNTASSLLSRTNFQVALSFPGERRDFVAAVAEGLRLAGVHVFYDEYYEADLAVPNLDTLLQRIYHQQSALIAVFLCREYEEKEWCGLEWRALRDLIKKKRGDAIMLFRFDDTEIPGLFSIDGYVDLNNRTPSEAVELICRRVHQARNAG